MASVDEQYEVEEAGCWSPSSGNSAAVVLMQDNDDAVVSSIPNSRQTETRGGCFPLTNTVEEDVEEAEIDKDAVITWMRGEINRQHGLLQHCQEERVHQHAQKDALIGELRYQLARQEGLLNHCSREIVALINKKELNVTQIRDSAVAAAQSAEERLHRAALRLLEKFFRAQSERGLRHAMSSWCMKCSAHGKIRALMEEVAEAKQEGGLGMLRLILRKMQNAHLAHHIAHWRWSHKRSKVNLSALELHEAAREREDRD